MLKTNLRPIYSEPARIASSSFSPPPPPKRDALTNGEEIIIEKNLSIDLSWKEKQKIIKILRCHMHLSLKRQKYLISSSATENVSIEPARGDQI